jgi:low affinity Fe/Cu permease
MPNGKRQSTRVERFKRGKIHPGPFRLAFTRFASTVATYSGNPWATLIVVALIVMWALTGPVFHFSDTWQLIANTVTTLVTVVMVFIVQSTQNRDAKAIHLKLDELLRAVPGARDEFMEAEEEDLDEILREKEIVDRADPAPPDTKEQRIKDPREERKAS